jgi:hypothetical protein
MRPVAAWRPAARPAKSSSGLRYDEEFSMHFIRPITLGTECPESYIEACIARSS